MIISNDKYHMSEINSSAYSVQMRLVIRNIQTGDFTGYRCISKNSIGDAEGNIRLYGKCSNELMDSWMAVILELPKKRSVVFLGFI